MPDLRPRFQAQAAWLIGPLTSNLPITAIIAHIKAPAGVFRSFASSNGFLETQQIFPSASEDPVLRTLLALPWERFRFPEDEAKGERLNFYTRALALPEYFREGYRKILPPHYAFYDHVSIREFLDPEANVYVCPVPEIVMYGRADVTMRFPRVSEMLAAHPHTLFEVDALVRLPRGRGQRTITLKEYTWSIWTTARSLWVSSLLIIPGGS